jgi:hypothetical protein
LVGKFLDLLLLFLVNQKAGNGPSFWMHARQSWQESTLHISLDLPDFRRRLNHELERERQSQKEDLGRKRNMRNRIALGPLTGFIFSLIAACANAQPPEPFGGRGIVDNYSSPPGWFGASVASNSESKEAPPWFGGSGSIRSARAHEMENRPRWLGPLFSRTESDEPSVFQKANERSRDFWNRTRHWTQEKNETFKNRTHEAWENLSRGLRPSSESQPDTLPAPYGAPLRMAENPDSTPLDRF